MTVRNVASGRLLFAWPYKNRKEAEVRKKQQESWTDSKVEPVVVNIETLNVDAEPYPPMIRKSDLNG